MRNKTFMLRPTEPSRLSDVEKAERLATLKQLAREGGKRGGVARLLLSLHTEGIRDEDRPDRTRPNQQMIKFARIAQNGPACEACSTVMPDASCLHLHHVIPIADGGRDIEANTVLVCPNCHAKAHWLHRQLTESERATDAPTLLALLQSA